MSGCDFDTLESLAFEELTPLLAAEARAHVAGCPACARELALLRAERGVFAARAKAPLPLPGFSAALVRSRRSGPAAAPAKAPPATARARFSWAVSAFGVAAAAAFAGLFLLPPGGPTGIDPHVAGPVVVEPASEDFCRDEAFATGFTIAPKSPTVCEMPESTGAHAAAEGETYDCGGCAPEAAEEIDTCGHDSCVTEACYSPTHN